MENLQIRCRSTAIFGYEKWTMLDSLLQRAMLLEQYGADYYLLPPLSPASPPEALLIPDLPLERRERGGQWYWACSWIDLDAASIARCKSVWVRRYPARDGRQYLRGRQYRKGRRGRLNIKTSEGPDKLYNMPMFGWVVDELCWYAVGDAAEIKRLLETYIHFLGKKTAYGNGQVCQYNDGAYWQVEPWPEDWSERDGAGRLTRPIPAQAGKSLDFIWMSIRPPYFVRANSCYVEMPVSREVEEL